jgi:hypothetical protein
VLNRRDDLNAPRRVGHKYGRILTLEKWETVSGRFARYLNLHDSKHYGKIGPGR